LSVSGGSDLGLFEINEAASLVSDSAHPDANIIFGAVIDDALGDEVRVTVIAAGFDGGQPKKRADVAPRRHSAEYGAANSNGNGHSLGPITPPARQSAGGSGGMGASPTAPPARRAVEYDDDLDIPDFLKP
jgi:cell division protein FtsZ